MDYRYLKAFILTAKYLNFSKAAKELHIAQSAVSRQIKLLEESLGEELIVRSSKKVILTQLGINLYQSSIKFENTLSGIFNDSGKRPLKIGILNGLLKNWFPPIVEKYRSQYQRELIIQIGEGENLVDKLVSGEYDMIFSNTQCQTETLTSRRLFEEEFVLISNNPTDLKKIEKYPWICYSHEDALFQLSKEKSQSLLIVDSISLIIKLVRMNLGIAVVPKHCLKQTNDLQVILLKKIKRSTIFLTTLSYHKMPNYISEFTQFL